jgi:hypothetical protein
MLRHPDPHFYKKGGREAAEPHQAIVLPASA